ncbi:hypothetical protein AVDCRST_MAG81-3282 [uncultured Synechococcales cyanobacterium]|uniref:Uncharacterized protein n=1 Tax=uncultured Synechococcales cyanobacterium TaxID=1936017 RepID=A0A6J4VQI3_9CYAN|nr:hypothetical protein AVDCRST_MAG81-3282 [uncultured Synechococcales cyanobacterium]
MTVVLLRRSSLIEMYCTVSKLFGTAISDKRKLQASKARPV